MNLSSLKKKFKDQWVLARVEEKDQYGAVTKVTPIAHAKRRQQIDQKLIHTQEKHITVLYTGEPKPRI